MGIIVAQRGNNVYLIQTAKDKARVLDLEQGKFFPEFNMQSILARGYWEEYEGSQIVLAELLKKVEKL